MFPGTGKASNAEITSGRAQEKHLLTSDFFNILNFQERGADIHTPP